MPGAEPGARPLSGGRKRREPNDRRRPAMTTIHLTLVPPQSLGLCGVLSGNVAAGFPLRKRDQTKKNAMSEPSPFRLTCSRILLLALGALALLYITGAVAEGGR